MVDDAALTRSVTAAEDVAAEAGADVGEAEVKAVAPAAEAVLWRLVFIHRCSAASPAARVGVGSAGGATAAVAPAASGATAGR